MSLRIVVLPHPEGPISERSSSRAMSNETSWSASVKPPRIGKRLLTCSISMSGRTGRSSPRPWPTPLTKTFELALSSPMPALPRLNQRGEPARGNWR